MKSFTLNRINLFKQKLNQTIVNHQDELLFYQQYQFSLIRVFDLETGEEVQLFNACCKPQIQSNYVFTIVELEILLNKLRKYNVDFKFIEVEDRDKEGNRDTWLELVIFFDDEITYIFNYDTYKKHKLYNTINHIYDNYKVEAI